LVYGDELDLIQMIRDTCPYPHFSLIKTDYKGYNIAALGKNFYGMRQMDGDLLIPEKVTQFETIQTAKEKLNNENILVFSSLTLLLEEIDKRY